MTKRRPTSRTPLLTPALAKTHRLGEAVSQALGQQGGRLAAPALASGRMSHGQRWGTPAPWQHGRVLHAATPDNAPSWQYPSLAQLGSATHQGGIALLELMLVIGVVAIGTAGVVATYRVVDNNRKVNAEVEHATTIAQNIVANSVTRGDFSIINQENALRDGLFPQEMLDGAGNPKTVWGGDVLVAATNIGGKANWGSVLTFEGVPASACAKLVSQAATGFYAVSINDTNVRSNYSPLNMEAVTRLCANDGARVQFTYAKHGGAGESFDPLTPCTVPSPETDVVVDAACPTGQLGSITYRTDYVCQSPYGPATDLPAVEVSNTCTPACVLPSPSTQTNTETRSASQTLACPSGQSSTSGGTAGITQVRTETRYQTRSASCPPSPGYTNPVGPYVWSSWSAFTAWEGSTPWTTSSNTCAPNCVVPSPNTETDTENRTATQTLACPTGQLGAIDQSRPEYRTRTRTASCPAPTGPVSWTPWGVWSPWTASAPWTTTSNTCAPECVLPTPSTQTNSETRTATQVIACPSGQLTPTGSSNGITQNRTEKRDQTRTASCPAPTGPYTWSAYGAFGPWYATTPWTTTTNECAPACTLPTPNTETNTETRTGTQTYTCPSGQLITTAGTSQYQASGPQTRGEQRSQTRAASCPAPTGAYTWSAWTAFSAWTGTTPWSPTYTCAPACVDPPDTVTTQNQTFTCPAGQLITTAGPSQYQSSGPQTRTATTTYTCSTPTSSLTTNPTTYSPWSPAYACAAVCTKPANTTGSRAGTPQTQTLTCPTGQSGAITQTRSVTEYQTITYNCPAPTGAYTTTYGPWGTPAPTYGTWTTTSNTCAPNCVAPPATTESRAGTPQYNPVACPYFQTGTYTYSRSTTEYRTVSYSCPAPTGAYSTSYGAWGTPAPTYGAWTPYSNTCALPACDGTLEGNARNYMSRYGDLYNAFGTNYTAAYNHWWQTGYYEGRGSCWGAPCSAPAPVNATESQTFTCPAGQRITTAGPYQYQTSGVQTRTRTTSYSCPTPTSTATANTPTYSAWSPAYTCAPSCVAPPAAYEYQYPRYYTDTACPYFQTGRIYYYRDETQRRTVTYSCPAPTGGATASYSAWSIISPAAWTQYSSNCALPACDGTLEGNARNYMSRYGDLYNAFGTNYTAAYNHWWQAGY